MRASDFLPFVRWLATGALGIVVLVACSFYAGQLLVERAVSEAEAGPSLGTDVAARSRPAIVASQLKVRTILYPDGKPPADDAIATVATAAQSPEAIAGLPSTGPVAETWIVTSSGGLNVRSEPASKSARVGVLDGGEAVAVIEERGKWVHVRSSSGVSGWVFAKYLRPGDTQAVASAD